MAQFKLKSEYSISEAMEFLPFKARATVVKLINTGRLKSIELGSPSKYGQRYIILGKWIKEYLTERKRAKPLKHMIETEVEDVKMSLKELLEFSRAKGVSDLEEITKILTSQK